MNDKKITVISLGGSLIVPEEINTDFIKKFKKVIESQIEKGYRFVIVTGGGKLARKYINSATKIGEIDNEEKDWLGIHATRMNAHFIKTILKKHCHQKINRKADDIDEFKTSNAPVLIAAGWTPGNSTDLVAVTIAKEMDIKKVINLSNIDYLYDKDPKEFFTAKTIKKINWKDFRDMVGDKWDPGLNTPFDPIASKLADENGIEVSIIGGKNLENMEKYLAGKEFEGTVIKN